MPIRFNFLLMELYLATNIFKLEIQTFMLLVMLHHSLILLLRNQLELNIIKWQLIWVPVLPGICLENKFHSKKFLSSGLIITQREFSMSVIIRKLMKFMLMEMSWKITSRLTTSKTTKWRVWLHKAWVIMEHFIWSKKLCCKVLCLLPLILRVEKKPLRLLPKRY